MTITMGNYKELADVVLLSKKHGFRGVVCNICATGAGADIPMAVKKSERGLIVQELKRVKRAYPESFLLSKNMIAWYEKSDHSERCHWGDAVHHFDAEMNERRCFGTNADCSNCGCLAGAFQNPLKMALSYREFVKLV
jgi:hypothetical protein